MSSSGGILTINRLHDAGVSVMVSVGGGEDVTRISHLGLVRMRPTERRCLAP